MRNGDFSRRLFWILFGAGLVARLAGLLFNGVFDIDEFLFKWGSGVKAVGLAKAFRENYGPFSYLLYGLWAVLADHIPRFWWAPYKAMEIAFEAGIFSALWHLTPPSKRFAVFALYWLNPWFVIHGAWHGFWEGPHTFFGLLAAGVFAAAPSPWLGWAGAGACLMASALFKPQGLFYFVIPCGFYAAVLFFKRGFRSALLWYLAGLFVVLIPVVLYLKATGAAWDAIPRNYLTVVKVMPNFCNECINVWRPISNALMYFDGQSGFTTQLKIPSWILRSVHAAAFGGVLALIGWFCTALAVRASENDARFKQSLLLVLAFAALAIPQLATKAHINHAYAGLVLFIPLVPLSRTLQWAWLSMVLIHLYCHLVDFQLGRASIYVPLHLRDYPYGAAFIERLRPFVHMPQDALLCFQSAAHGFLSSLPREPWFSILSAAQFILTIYLLRTLFRYAKNR